MYWIILNAGYLIRIKGKLRKGKTFFLPIVAWRIIRNLYFEVRSVYVGNKRTEKKLNNKLCKSDWLLFFRTVLREKILPLGFSLLITHIAMAQRSLFDFCVSKNKQTAKPTGQT